MAASNKGSIVFDSSCWIEYLTEGRLSKACARELQSASEVVVPTVVIYEVYRKIASTVSDDQALSVIALLSQRKVAELSREVALAAADISIARALPMADSLVLAHAEHEGAVLVTLDNDFARIPSARVIR